MRVIGLDIGTTTICALFVDSDTGKTLEAAVAENRFVTDGTENWEKRQDPQHIFETAKRLVSGLVERYNPITGIGVTGQMHGIVYVDDCGSAVSPLFTWQDGRGDRLCPNGVSHARRLSDLTGYPLATGFGSVTHFYNVRHGLVPDTARTFCTIHDYVAMKLAGRSVPRVHPSDAASFGLFRLEDNRFDEAAIAAAGMNIADFPAVGSDYEELGRTEDGIPVFIAIGDNQASFLGSVRDMKQTVLVNVGTGSQISLLSEKLVRDAVMETRPCVEGTYLLVGSSLCGGRAYALLESFFREIVREAGLECKSLYPVLDRLTAGFEELPKKLSVSTRFSGTRRNPEERGSVSNLGIENFTPRHFAIGILEGMVTELYEMYAGLTCLPGFQPAFVAGSGNGIRKGDVLRRMFEIRFGAPVYIPEHREEAAYGAALCALVGVGAFKNMWEAQSIICYQK